ncbi:uncharacterized protein N7477_004791, partial [Penicillium maclennaniae]|uniref:uncharacterized protein n=1 Tax=Penicillium maclennaniae TaxID=1343394 RepID=UPI002540357D
LDCGENILTHLQAQTPQQRRANERFAKTRQQREGRGHLQPSPSRLPSHLFLRAGLTTIVVLAFVVCGGLLLELLKIVPEVWSTVASMLSRLTG